MCIRDSSNTVRVEGCPSVETVATVMAVGSYSSLWIASFSQWSNCSDVYKRHGFTSAFALVVKEYAVYSKHAIAFAVVLSNPKAILLSLIHI